MKKILTAALIVIALASQARADSHLEKIKTLMKVQGVFESFDQQLRSNKAAYEKNAKDTFEQMMAGYSVPDKYKARYENAVKKFVSKVQSALKTDDLVAVWSEHYMTKFSDTELDQLIKFYSSDIGQKAVRTSKAAAADCSKYMSAAIQPVLVEATQEYIADMNAIAEEIKK